MTQRTVHSLGRPLAPARKLGPRLRGLASGLGPQALPRRGLHVHKIGKRGDIRDTDGHFGEAYQPSPGDWKPVRPDGYVGSIVPSTEIARLETYLLSVGLVPQARGAI